MLLLINRGDGTRTHGLCVPNAALYQTEPRLVFTTDIIPKFMNYVKFEKEYLQMFQFQSVFKKSKKHLYISFFKHALAILLKVSI